uniref:Transcriptional regulator n=1 Tax=Parastrongyloides trichosuri TaxID=131310 RepID=A0A0N4Z812_PARTI
MRDGEGQPFRQSDLGLPAQACPGPADVRAALQGIIDRQIAVNRSGARSAGQPNGVGQFGDRHLVRIADVDGLWAQIGHGIKAQQRRHGIGDIAEGAGLRAIAVNGDRLARQSLGDEIGDHPPVVGRHAGAIGVENAGDARVHRVVPGVVRAQGFGGTLAFVVAGADTDRVDPAPVALHLRMDFRIAIDLAGAGLHQPRAKGAGPV